MPYTPDATDVANPTDTGIKASTAAAEFRALKTRLANVIAGLVPFTGNVTVNGSVTATGKASFGAAYNTDSDSNTVLDGGTFVLAAAVTQAYKTQFEIDAAATYINSNQKYTGGSWQLYDALKAPAQIVLYSTSADSAIGFSTKAANTATPAERMRIDKNGNVSISTAGSQLTVNGNGQFSRTGSTTVYFNVNNDVAGLQTSVDANNAYLTAQGDFLYIMTGADYRMTFDALGSVIFSPSSFGTKTTLKVDGSFGTNTITYVPGTTYSVTSTDFTVRMQNNTTVTLPAAGDHAGRILVFASEINPAAVFSASSNIIPLKSAVATNVILDAAYQCVMLQSNGLNWVVIMRGA